MTHEQAVRIIVAMAPCGNGWSGPLGELQEEAARVLLNVSSAPWRCDCGDSGGFTLVRKRCCVNCGKVEG